MKHTNPLHTRRRLMLSAFVFVLAVLVLQTSVSYIGFGSKKDVHAAASTFVVCHVLPGNVGGERYFCSQEGCFSSDKETMSVVGTFEDESMCAGLSKELQSGLTK